jgi:drug/metabolite transporter (DMT)-like permease
MEKAAVTTESPPRSASRISLQLILAFFAIYFIWGSTYLSIRILVETVPPLFAAAVRFSIAGFVLFIWSLMRGEPVPSRLEWRNLSVMGALMFLAAYAGLFWAETRIASGIASVLVATIPVWTSIFEIFLFKKARLRTSLVIAICLGLAGVVLLASNTGVGKVSFLACLAILGAEISWSFGTVLSKGLALPQSKSMSAAGQMMTGGILLLFFSAVAGELRVTPHFSARATAALVYLIVAGSLLAFTAYIWLLGRLPATKVASYAYVNPVVALAIGYWFGGEALTLRTIAGAALILISVLLLLGGFGKRSADK